MSKAAGFPFHSEHLFADHQLDEQAKNEALLQCIETAGQEERDT